MSQFHQVFFDEADEHLASMESLLLAMDVSCPESEDLHAIFRAAHSIKGGAATFGFSDMADLTHVLENLLDWVRKGSMALTAPMVDVFLQSKDVLLDMLSAHKGGGEADPAVAEEVKRRLIEIENGAAPAGGGGDAEPVAATEGEPDGDGRLWTLFIELMPVDGVDARKVFDALEVHGDLTVVQDGVAAEELPWVAVFTSALVASEVAESLAFMLAPGQYRISVDQGVEDSGAFGFFQPGDSAEAARPALVREEDADGGFGLFEPLAPSGAAPSGGPDQDIEGDGFGLFAQAPGLAKSAEEPVKPAASAQPAAAARQPDKTAAGAENSIRVNIEKVDLLLNLVGELVITQSMLMQSGSQLDPVEHERLLNGISALQRNSRELQEAVMSIRMTPIAFVFNRFPRVVRDLAGRLGKKVELKMVGENTELDKGFIEKLSDPLTHLVRNSLDHGIESPEERQGKGKSPTGRLTLRAFHQGGSIVIEVSDDGAGLNRDRILAKARERGMAVPDGISDPEVWGLIFEAGFSTAAEVTDVSGRGVGMDVVKRNIQDMGGRIEIDSMPDVGTTMSIRLPLTLAIMDGMSVRVGGEIYVLPLGFILESLQPARREIKTVAGRGEVVHIRGEYLPIVTLARYFGVTGAKSAADEGILVIVEASDARVALLVDDLIGQQQFVVKNLETNYRKVDGLSGATILGDGQVALILDISTIARASGGQRAAQQAAQQAAGVVE
ncbi:chemotaxis protein CheW [Chromobacterium vaccinii]|uniref:chemotaxis protein CheW n=1 Tax=Chromobacterium vaccinii TaxID=1108595 RepID=UPI003C7740A5